MNWIEWNGEPVGDYNHTVCICVYTHVDDGAPVVAIIARAFCWGQKKRPKGNEWYFFEGDSTKQHLLTSVPRKPWENGQTEDEYINIYHPERGDRVYYCVPTLPTGEAFSLNTVRKSFYKGLSVVNTRTDLLQESDLQEK